MEMRYFDAHCHPQFVQFDADRDAITGKMAEAGVGGIVVGCDAASSRAACTMVQKHDFLYASVGQHPNHETDEAFDEHLYRNLLMYPRTVAIGECGLDYYRPEAVDDELKKKQKALFLRHIHLAGQTKRPLIVHARPSKGEQDAYEDALDLLTDAKKQYGDDLKGDFHFFVGNEEIARRAAEIDFTMSYTAVITFARDYDETIRSIPLSHLLSETDAPYVAPASRRGQRNDPLAVIDVVQKLAEIRGEDKEVVREAVLQNAERVFRLSEYAI